jgi:hypothetical protein
LTWWPAPSPWTSRERSGKPRGTPAFDLRLSHGPDGHIFGFERVTALEAIYHYQRRVLKRLNGEMRQMKDLGERQLSLLDQVNEIFGDTPAAKYATNRASLVVRAMARFEDAPDPTPPPRVRRASDFTPNLRPQRPSKASGRPSISGIGFSTADLATSLSSTTTAGI